MEKICPECSSVLECCNDTRGCWCESLPAVMPLTEGAQCLCPACLREKTEAVEAWNAVAETYAQKYSDEILLKPVQEFLRDFLSAIPANGLVCDMGCGPGQVARYVKNSIAHKTTGIDLSPEMITQAKRLNPSIPFEARDMLLMPEKEIYDAVIGLYFIVNFPPVKLPLVFQKLHQLLKNGGKLLLSFHTGNDEHYRNENLWDSGKPLSFYFFKPETIRKVLEENGFKVTGIREREGDPKVEYASRRAYLFAEKIQN
jgi:SAM-dependent methyltransferase